MSRKSISTLAGDVESMRITGQDRVVYGRALEIIRPFGVELGSAMLEYAGAKSLLGGHSLIEAAGLLARCSAELRHCFALAAFAGLRMEEILRIEWTDVDRRPGFISDVFRRNMDDCPTLVLINIWLGMQPVLRSYELYVLSAELPNSKPQR